MEGLVFSAGAGGTISTKGGTRPTEAKARVSFRDMVMGNKEAPPPRKTVYLLKEGLASITYENGNPLLPKVTINDSVFEGLCAPWKDALVVKLLGKRLGYNVLKDRLMRLWKLSSGFDMMDIGNDFYMVKFDVELDRTKVLEEGPWMIFDHYLTVQTWTPEFTSPSAKIERTVVWIRFTGLNLFYYDESILLAMAAAVGKPVRVDKNTLDIRRGRFARVCIEIDLTKPVVGKVFLKDHWYRVEYEGLHRICTTCGCYGHLGQDCMQKASTTTLTTAETTKQDDGARVQAQDAAVTDKETTVDKSVPSSKNLATEEIPEPLHGDWIMVQRKQRNNKPQVKIGKSTINPKRRENKINHNHVGTAFKRIKSCGLSLTC